MKVSSWKSFYIKILYLRTEAMALLEERWMTVIENEGLHF